MTASNERHVRIIGIDWGTAALALSIGLVLTLGISAITRSIGPVVVAGVSVSAGLVLTLLLLPRSR